MQVRDPSPSFVEYRLWDKMACWDLCLGHPLLRCLALLRALAGSESSGGCLPLAFSLLSQHRSPWLWSQIISPTPSDLLPDVLGMEKGARVVSWKAQLQI